MLCQNCGNNEANVKYTQIINGVKKQMNLCNSCAKELGIENIGFNMPIDFSSFLGNTFGEYEHEYIPSMLNINNISCDKCNMTYEEFLNKGKFGCENCYEAFENKINPLLKGIQGGNKHIGRVAKGVSENKEKIESKTKEKQQKSKEQKKEETIELLNKRLKQEIKEERYEDAAKTRDEIKRIQQE